VGKNPQGSLFIPDGKGHIPGVIFFHAAGSTGDTYFEAQKDWQVMEIWALCLTSGAAN